MMHARIVVLIVSVFWALSASAAEWQQHQYITDSFVKIALRNEYQKDSQYHVVRKWAKPIKVYVDSEVGDAKLHKQLVKIQLKHLQSITRHSLSLVDDKDDANMFVVFTQFSKMKTSLARYKLWEQVGEKILADAACIANVTASRKGKVFKTVIHIPEDSTRAKGLFVNCVVEEITQAMGLLNDSEQVFPSVFNDKSKDRYLTGLDYVLLRFLYHPYVQIGMREADIRALAPRILGQFQRQGIIDYAAKDVLEGSMQNWVDQ